MATGTLLTLSPTSLAILMDDRTRRDVPADRVARIQRSQRWIGRGALTRVGKVLRATGLDEAPQFTGLAQLVGVPPTDAALELDRTYTTRWNPLLDCQPIALSFAVNVFGKSGVQRRLRRSRLVNSSTA